jgi:hypothetical protein
VYSASKDLVFACGVHTVPDRSIRNEWEDQVGYQV